MPEEIITIRIFSKETDAAMAQQVIQESGDQGLCAQRRRVRMEPHSSERQAFV